MPADDGAKACAHSLWPTRSCRSSSGCALGPPGHALDNRARTTDDCIGIAVLYCWAAWPTAPPPAPAPSRTKPGKHHPVLSRLDRRHQLSRCCPWCADWTRSCRRSSACIGRPGAPSMTTSPRIWMWGPVRGTCAQPWHPFSLTSPFVSPCLVFNLCRPAECIAGCDWPRIQASRRVCSSNTRLVAPCTHPKPRLHASLVCRGCVSGSAKARKDI